MPQCPTTEILQSGYYQNFTQSEPMTREKILNISVSASVNLIPRHINDTRSLEQFCKDTVITIWYYHGGAHVGRVVTPDYKVLGVDRLRIIDGSVYNESPGTNPQATVMMMGRYMGQKILRDRRGRASDV